MTTYTYPQLEEIWLSASQGTKYHTQSWAELMAAIALAESSGISDNTNPTDNGGTQTSWGLWQISLGNHNAPSPNWADPVENAKLAIGKLDTQGLGAWGTYTRGAYRQYLNSSAQPSTGAIPGAGSGGGSSPGTAQGNAMSSGAFLTDSITTTGWHVPSWAGKVLGIAGTLFDPFGGATDIGGLVQDLSALSHNFSQVITWMTWLFSPSSWLRVGAFILALILGNAGFFFLVKAF